MKESRTTRRHVLAGSIVFVSGLAAPGLTMAQDATPVAPGSTDWPMYGYDLSGDKASAASGLSAVNVDSLTPLWEVQVDGPVSATPVIVDHVAYVGAYDGTLSAIDLQSGELRWTYATGAMVTEPNLKIPLGISGSAVVSDHLILVGDAAAVVHALERATGNVRWTRKIDDQPQASIWSSPVVSGDKVFIGVASIAKEVGFRGSVVALDVTTGDLRWKTYMVPEGADGAGVFAVPAIDERRGVLYVGTQNAYSPNPAPYGNPVSVVALDTRNGDIKWAFNAPPGGGHTAPTDDVGFSASPNLFTVKIHGQTRDLVGEGQKSGDFWALDRDSGNVVWKATVSPAGFLGGMEGTSAVADTIIAVPATNWPNFDGPATGMVTALDAITGKILWTSTQDAPAASPVAIANDLVLHAGLDGVLHVYALATGDELWHAELGASVSGGIAVGEGVVVLGAATPEFAPFIKPGNTVRAFGLTGRSGCGTSRGVSLREGPRA
jgi:polyvinyl alcohol dehydrogenase (cytochrome)